MIDWKDLRDRINAAHRAASPTGGNGNLYLAREDAAILAQYQGLAEGALFLPLETPWGRLRVIETFAPQGYLRVALDPPNPTAHGVHEWQTDSRPEEPVKPNPETVRTLVSAYAGLLDKPMECPAPHVCDERCPEGVKFTEGGVGCPKVIGALHVRGHGVVVAECLFTTPDGAAGARKEVEYLIFREVKAIAAKKGVPVEELLTRKPPAPGYGTHRWKYTYYEPGKPVPSPVHCPAGHLAYVEGPGKDPMCLIGLCEYAHAATAKLDLKGRRCSTCGGPWSEMRRECESKRCWRAWPVSGA